MEQQTVRENLFEFLVNPACIINSSFSIVDFNEEFAALSAISKEKNGKKGSLHLALDIDLFQRKPTPLDAIREKKERFIKTPIKAINGKGKHLNLRMSIVPLASLTPDGDSDLYMMLFLNLTEQSTENEKNSPALEQELRDFHVIQKALNYELDIAKKVQASLLPHVMPSLITFDIASIYAPVDKVGGDVYDLIQTKDNKIAIFIFDVSGHGVPSALIGAMAKTLFTYHLKNGCKPSEVFTYVNKELCTYIKSGHYLTAFLGIIDPADNTMTYAQAGHVYPVIYHNNRGTISSIAANSLFIGHIALADIAEYHDSMVKFDWNDKLLLYTDGITDSINDMDEMYGQERLKEAVLKYCHEKPDVFIKMINRDNEHFRNGCPVLDDFSLLCVQFGCSQEILNLSGFTKEEKPEIIACLSHDDIEDACSRIMMRLDKNGYTHTEIFHAHIVIHELLSNAFEHGNNYDPEKKVIVFFKVLLEQYSASIIDEGSGFPYNRLKRELDTNDFKQTRGKGLYVVRKLMDEVSFNETGNRILVKKFKNKELA